MLKALQVLVSHSKHTLKHKITEKRPIGFLLLVSFILSCMRKVNSLWLISSFLSRCEEDSEVQDLIASKNASPAHIGSPA